MNRKTAIIVSLAVAILVLLPVMPGPASACNDNTLCIPNQKLSLTAYYIGFGTYVSYGGRFYGFCFGFGPSNCEVSG